MKHNHKKHLLVPAFTALLATANAQDAAAPAASQPDFYNHFLANGLLIFAAMVIVGAFLVLLRLLNIMIKVQQIKIYQEQGLEAYQESVKGSERASFWKQQYKRWTNVVPVEKEEEILFDHNYDGIRELDNSLPPWWVAMFVVTVVFAAIYLGYYHVSDAGPGSHEEYEAEILSAQEAIAAFQAKQADKVDEANLVPMEKDGDLAAGKTIYTTNCVACHGTLGEGGVGPNLTDKFWIHGGSIQNIYQTIKNGVPEKGMISWKAQLRPVDMHRVASYILKFQGTTPPNAKAPQGTEYIPESTLPDSTAAESTTGQ